MLIDGVGEDDAAFNAPWSPGTWCDEQTLAERGDGFLNPLLQFRPNVTSTPQDVRHGRAGNARSPRHIVDGGAAVFSGTLAPGAHP